MGRMLRSLRVWFICFSGGLFLIIALLVVGKLFIAPYVVECPNISREMLDKSAASTFHRNWRKYGNKDEANAIQLGDGGWKYDSKEKQWTHDVIGHPKGYSTVIEPCTSGGYFAEE